MLPAGQGQERTVSPFTAIRGATNKVRTKLLEPLRAHLPTRVPVLIEPDEVGFGISTCFRDVDE